MTLEKLGQEMADLRSVVLRANAPEVMTPGEAAEFLGVTTETLYRWRKDAWGPKYSQVNARIVRYLRDDLVAFLREKQG
ncbi:AlpA family transcriptional regulator [Roseinatronobacter sp. S2]|uniref:helix-turn-helix transcriptional regulator n=1 Tax=Roseinatronobacter sp. S2 TaxID=3035471 RepID=UPI00240F90AA|nr:helix-turn-helix domain-containing protein [Roseinatronobacter sp. S2]WFE74258.1 helix-turn-helix domain-containing protein [Roseinatronobacter sp. S2]